MPSDQRVRFHDREHAAPINRQGDERNPSRIVGAARLHLALHVQRQLLSQKQILSGELGVRPCGCGRQPHEVVGDTQDGSDRAAALGQRHGRRIAREVRKPPRSFDAHGALLNRFGIAQFRRKFGRADFLRSKGVAHECRPAADRSVADDLWYRASSTSRYEAWA